MDRRPYALFVLVLFQGLSGVAGGIGLAGDPSGQAVGLPLEWLAGSPFRNYLVPGIVLLIVLGLFPLVVCVGLWGKRRWSVLASMAIGFGLLVWIGVQIAVVGYHARPPLQLIYGLLGVAILVLAVLRTAVRAQRRGPAQPDRVTITRE